MQARSLDDLNNTFPWHANQAVLLVWAAQHFSNKQAYVLLTWTPALLRQASLCPADLNTNTSPTSKPNILLTWILQLFSDKQAWCLADLNTAALLRQASLKSCWPNTAALLRQTNKSCWFEQCISPPTCKQASCWFDQQQPVFVDCLLALHSMAHKVLDVRNTAHNLTCFSVALQIWNYTGEFLYFQICQHSQILILISTVKYTLQSCVLQTE